MNKRGVLKGMSALALGALLPLRAMGQGTPARRPNVLFIIADDLDYSLLDFMDGPKGLMPNIEALAARSHRMVNARAVAPICQPSREALLSGRLPHRSGALGFHPMREGTPTLVTMLQAQGYFAGAVRKIEHMLPLSSFPWDYAQGAGTFARASTDRNPLLYQQGLALAIAEAKSRSKPFLFCCNISDPHRPFYGSPAGLKMDHQNEGPYRIPHPVGPADVTVPPCLEDLPEVRAELAQYWNSAQRLDISVGKALAALEASGEADNTIVLFLSDNGMPLPFGKATVYDSGTRCPVLISWPGMAAARTHDAPTTHVDIVPTLLDILGIDRPAGLDGVSLLPLLRGDAAAVPPAFAVTYVNTLAGGANYPQRAIQDRRYSYMFSPWADGRLAFQAESMRGLTYNAMVEAAKGNAAIAARVRQYRYGEIEGFYDLVADPGQRHNLIASPRHAARVAGMKRDLLDHLRRTGDPQLDNFLRLAAGKPMVVPQTAASGEKVE